MAQKTIQIADKPTLDSVAETLALLLNKAEEDSGKMTDNILLEDVITFAEGSIVLQDPYNHLDFAVKYLLNDYSYCSVVFYSMLNNGYTTGQALAELDDLRNYKEQLVELGDTVSILTNTEMLEVLNNSRLAYVALFGLSFTWATSSWDATNTITSYSIGSSGSSGVTTYADIYMRLFLNKDGYINIYSEVMKLANSGLFLKMLLSSEYYDVLGFLRYYLFNLSGKSDGSMYPRKIYDNGSVLIQNTSKSGYLPLFLAIGSTGSKRLVPKYSAGAVLGALYKSKFIKSVTVTLPSALEAAAEQELTVNALTKKSDIAIVGMDWAYVAGTNHDTMKFTIKNVTYIPSHGSTSIAFNESYGGSYTGSSSKPDKLPAQLYDYITTSDTIFTVKNNSSGSALTGITKKITIYYIQLSDLETAE